MSHPDYNEGFKAGYIRTHQRLKNSTYVPAVPAVPEAPARSSGEAGMTEYERGFERGANNAAEDVRAWNRDVGFES